MKSTTIILLLLFLLLGCSTMDRPEINASDPTALPSELVKSSFKNNTSEMVDTVKHEILQRLNIVDPTNEEIRTEKEPLLLIASLRYNETEDVSPAAIPLRCVYRNNKHFSLPESRRKDEITDAGWLPPADRSRPFRFAISGLLARKSCAGCGDMGKSKTNMRHQRKPCSRFKEQDFLGYITTSQM